MIFFKSALTISLLSILFVGCSGSVQDKNSQLNNSEKNELRKKSNEDSIEISKLTMNPIAPKTVDGTAKGVVVEQRYEAEACLKDRRSAKNLGNRTINIDGVQSKLNSNGCFYWTEIVKVDYKYSNTCLVKNKQIKLGNGISKNFKYSVDYRTNHISNLDNNNGCDSSTNSKLGQANRDPIQLQNAQLNYGNILSELRSDKKHINHTTKISSCVEVSIDGKPLANSEIYLTATNKKTGKVSETSTETVPTDSAGCFTTDFASEYEQYRNSHWMEIDIAIEVAKGPLKGAKTNRSVYINPWEPSRAHYGIGEVGRKPVEREFKNDYAKFHLDGIMYIQIGNDAEEMFVNDSLGLTIFKKYQVVFNPYVDREHRYSPNTHAIEQIQKEGQFKLSMILLAPKEGGAEIDKGNYENFSYITGVEKTVTVKNGIINEVVNIPFKMTDLPRLATTTISVFKIEPVGDTGIRPTIVTGFFKARIPWIKTNVLPAKDLNIPGEVSQLWAHFGKNKKQDFKPEDVEKTCSIKRNIEKDLCVKAIKALKNDSSIDGNAIAYKSHMENLFSKLNNNTKRSSGLDSKISAKQIYTNHLKSVYPELVVLGQNEAKKNYGMNFIKSDFDAILPPNKRIPKFTESMTEEICRYSHTRDGEYKPVFFGMLHVKKSYKECLENVGKYFNIKPVRHVRFVEKTGKIKSDGHILNVGERLGVSRGENDSESRSSTTSLGFDAGIAGKFGPDKSPLSAGLGFKVGHSWSWSKTHSKGDGYSFGESVASGKALGVEWFIVDLKLLTNRCFLIDSKDHLDRKLAIERQQQLITSNGMIDIVRDVPEGEEDYFYPQKNFNIQFYICEDKPIQEEFTESWYFIQSRVVNSLAADIDSVSERTLFKVIRGTDSYHELKEALRKIIQGNLAIDNIGYFTPAQTLLEGWGHLFGDKVPQDEIVPLLREHFEGAFPGTIESNGSMPARNLK